MLDVRFEILQHATRRPSIVMLGDSITAGLPWRDASECADVSNYGMDGDTTEGIINRLREVLILRPNAVFLMIGANDILKRHTTTETANNVRHIVNKLEDIGTTVYVHPVLPIDGIEHMVSETNLAISRALANARATIVPLPIEVADTRDGIHLATSGFLKWRDAISSLMRQHC
jgi:lysophospholipase L1-like esterase